MVGEPLGIFRVSGLPLFATTTQRNPRDLMSVGRI